MLPRGPQHQQQHPQGAPRWQRFGDKRSRAGRRNPIRSVTRCETCNYRGNLESCNDYKNKYFKRMEINRALAVIKLED